MNQDDVKWYEGLFPQRDFDLAQAFELLKTLEPLLPAEKHASLERVRSLLLIVCELYKTNQEAPFLTNQDTYTLLCALPEEKSQKILGLLTRIYDLLDEVPT